MDAVVMCGGRGTRLGTETEKPLFPIDGVPMVDRVLDALSNSGIGRCYAAPSSDTPETQKYLDCPCIDTPGEGYVADLDVICSDDRISTPMLTIVADLPLIDGTVIDRVLAAHDTGSLSVLVPASTKRTLGVSLDTTFRREDRHVAPAGVNIVGNGGESSRIIDHKRLAVNVNRPRDARIAAYFASRMDYSV
jgi:adenosylcobinamide-phosphate guanylyltransferase